MRNLKLKKKKVIDTKNIFVVVRGGGEKDIIQKLFHTQKEDE